MRILCKDCPSPLAGHIIVTKKCFAPCMAELTKMIQLGQGELAEGRWHGQVMTDGGWKFRCAVVCSEPGTRGDSVKKYRVFGRHPCPQEILVQDGKAQAKFFEAQFVSTTLTTSKKILFTGSLTRTAGSSGTRDDSERDDFQVKWIWVST